MRTLTRIVLLGYSGILLLLFGCQKDIENALNTGVSPPSTFDTENLFPAINGLKNGYIVFNSLDGYFNTMALASTYSFETKLEWNKRLGFESVAFQENEIRNRYEAIQTEEQLAQFKSEFDSDSYFAFDDGYFTTDLLGSINWFVDKNQLFFINENLYKKTSDYLIIIENGREDLLKVAEQTLETNEALGIYVIHTPDSESEINFRGPYCDNEHEVIGKFGESNKKRMRYEWRIDYVGEPLFVNGVKVVRNVYVFDASMRTHKKKGFIWVRTWIDARIQLLASELGNTLFFQSCSPYYTINWPTNINIQETRMGVAEMDVMRIIRDYYNDDYCVLVPQYFTQYGNYRSLCERLDDDRTIDEAGLHVVIDCNR
ncbi:MAG: hypothetical protein R2828_27340 [Saprospiraceae bacterium]